MNKNISKQDYKISDVQIQKFCESISRLLANRELIDCELLSGKYAPLRDVTDCKKMNTMFYHNTYNQCVEKITKEIDKN